MLYTVIPLNRIYNKNIGMVADNAEEIWKDEHVPYENGYLQITGDSEKKIISRLLSSNMEDYLKEEFQPGKLYLE